MFNGHDHNAVDHSAEFRRCLVECDVAGARKLWRHIAPHLPQPKTDYETLAIIHNARTQMDIGVTMKQRAYSHRWLLDNELPSSLPDHLKPYAERLYPRVVEAVGIAVKAGSPERAPLAAEIRKAMEEVAGNCMAERPRKSAEHIRSLMATARARMYKKLLG